MDRLGKVAIVGVGLIGGSIGLALRSRSLADRVVGVGRDPQKLDLARSSGAIDEATTEIEDGVRGAEVVVVCTPVSRSGDIRRSAAAAHRNTLITDAGSTKRHIVEAIEEDATAAGLFVAAHPIAGSERSGASNARADLFDDRVCVLTPTSRTPADRLVRARSFWSSIGCRIVEANPGEHDEILAYTSHLPHAVASALASAIPLEWQQMAGGAFRDTTRVAAADTALWTAIFRDNRGPLLKALGSLQDRVSAFKFAVMTDDEEAMRRWWDEGRGRRRQYESNQNRPEPGA